MIEKSARLYKLKEPRQWIAAYAGTQELYFPCFACQAPEPEIAGFLAKGPEYKDILVIDKGDRKYLALICTKCIESYVDER